MDKKEYSLALFLSRLMEIIGFVLFVGGLITGIILTIQSRHYGNAVVGYGGFFDRHENAYIGLPLILAAFTFGLPFAAIGSYMSVRLKAVTN